MKFNNVVESNDDRILLKWPQHKDAFKKRPSDLVSYIRFKEADWYGNIDVEVYNKIEDGIDHIKYRFDRQHDDVGRIGDYIAPGGYNAFKWPQDYIKKLHKGFKKINQLYNLDNKAYVIYSNEQFLAYMIIIAQYAKDGEFNLDRKLAMVNTIFSTEMGQTKTNFEHRNNFWVFKDIKIEHREMTNIPQLLEEFNIPNYEFIPIIEV